MEGGIAIIAGISIFLLTAITLIVGIWLVMVLRQIYQLAKKINQAVSEAEALAMRLNEPIDFVSDLLGGLENGLEVVKLIGSFFQRRNKDERIK